MRKRRPNGSKTYSSLKTRHPKPSDRRSHNLQPFRDHNPNRARTWANSNWRQDYSSLKEVKQSELSQRRSCENIPAFLWREKRSSNRLALAKSLKISSQRNLKTSSCTSSKTNRLKRGNQGRRRDKSPALRKTFLIWATKRGGKAIAKR